MLRDLARAQDLDPARCLFAVDAAAGREAAARAGFGAFRWAWEFFGRPAPV